MQKLVKMNSQGKRKPTEGSWVFSCCSKGFNKWTFNTSVPTSYFVSLLGIRQMVNAGTKDANAGIMFWWTANSLLTDRIPQNKLVHGSIEMEIYFEERVISRIISTHFENDTLNNSSSINEC